MQKFIVTILLCSATYGQVNCQSAYHPYMAAYLSSANTTAHFVSVLNAAFDPSLIPFIKRLEAASFAEKKYLSDINILLATVCAPFNGNGLLFMFQRYGNASFHESTLELAYGKDLGTVNAGVFFRNVRVKIQHGQSVSMISAGIALTIKINEHVFAGWKMSNPDLFIKPGAAKLRTASSYSFALGWEASSEVYAGMESQKDEGQPLSIIFALKYRFAEKFKCALNWNTYSNQPFASVSWQENDLLIEAGCSYHSTLGASPAVSVFYRKPLEK